VQIESEGRERNSAREERRKRDMIRLKANKEGLE
jgi:hypothetical protein